MAALKGEISISDQEKFEGFKLKLVDGNEQKYGEETRAKYGDAAMDEANAKLKGLTEEQLAPYIPCTWIYD